MSLAFTAAILTALTIVAFRRGRHALVVHRLRQNPGFKIEHPCVVTDYRSIDVTVSNVRCPHCGKGRLHQMGENHATGSTGPIVVIHTECLRCEDPVRLYFDVSGVPN